MKKEMNKKKINSPRSAFIKKILKECPIIGRDEEGYDLYEQKDGKIIRIKKSTVNGLLLYDTDFILT